MELSSLRQVYNKLGDDLSREIYTYRIMTSISGGGEQWNIKLARTNETLMQFIYLLKRHPGQVVVMGSGYRGKQLVHFNQDIELKKRIGNKLKSVIAFEPDAMRVKECKNNLEAAHINYRLIEKGGWSKDTTLHFVNSGGLLTMSDSGEEVEVTSVDYVLNGEKATFIKMDIEGAEYEALKGCRITIQKYRPKLAICMYHKYTDIFEVPALILEYCPEYKFYLRHYSPDFTETVLYGIPEM